VIINKLKRQCEKLYIYEWEIQTVDFSDKKVNVIFGQIY